MFEKVIRIIRFEADHKNDPKREPKEIKTKEIKSGEIKSVVRNHTHFTPVPKQNANLCVVGL
jgi:hypothetical protein